MQNAIKLEYISVTQLHHRLVINVGKLLLTLRLIVNFVITCISSITDFQSKYMLDFSY